MESFKIKVSYFKEDQDWDNDPTLKAYFVEYTEIQNRVEEGLFYESLSHEANLKIEIL